MTAKFDSAAFARRLEEAGTPPAAAAAFAALFEDCLLETLPTKADITALRAEISNLGSRIGDETETLLGALKTETALLLKQSSFSMTMRKMSYRAYLENLQFMVNIGGIAVVAVILLAILWKMF